MGIFLAIMIGATIGAVITWRQREEFGLQAAYNLVNAGLPNDSDLVKAAAKRFQRRQEAFTIGSWLGGFSSLVVLVYLGSPIIGILWSALIGMLGVAIAICTLHFRAVRAARQDGPRLAALGHRRLRDYLIWPEIVFQYGVLVLPLATACLGVLVLARYDDPGVGWTLIGVGLVCLAICAVALVLQQRVLHLSQPASGEDALRWEEALRASTLRDLSEVMMWACWLLGGAAVITADLPAEMPAFIEPLTYILFGGGIVGMLVAQTLASGKWGLRQSQRAIG